MSILLKPKWQMAAILDFKKIIKTIEPLNQSSSKLFQGSTPIFKIICYLKKFFFAATKMANGRHFEFPKSQFTFKRLNHSSSNLLQAFIPKFKTIASKKIHFCCNQDGEWLPSDFPTI